MQKFPTTFKYGSMWVTPLLIWYIFTEYDDTVDGITVYNTSWEICC